MIETKIGDMLKEAKSGFLVHGCNCQGRMGSGIAVAVKNTYPEAYDEYQRRFRVGYNNVNGIHQRGLELGSVIPVPINDDLVVVNAMTQTFYKNHPMLPNAKRYVDYEAMASAFELINFTVKHQLTDVPKVVNFPLIGAGLAGGSWKIIEAIIDEMLDDDIKKVLWVLP